MMGKMENRALHYHGDQINQLISKMSKMSDEYVDKLLVYWLENLLEHRIVDCGFEEQKWELPDKYTPLQFKVARAASALEGNFLKRDQTNDQHILGTWYVAEVVKVTGLSSTSRGSIQLLSEYSNCSHKFAKSVMLPIENNGIENYLTRNIRCDSIHANRQWTDLIIKYVLKPENARAVPRREQVSIKYGVQHPKFIPRKPQAIIAFHDRIPHAPRKEVRLCENFLKMLLLHQTRTRNAIAVLIIATQDVLLLHYT